VGGLVDPVGDLLVDIHSRRVSGVAVDTVVVLVESNRRVARRDWAVDTESGLRKQVGREGLVVLRNNLEEGGLYSVLAEVILACGLSSANDRPSENMRDNCTKREGDD
jgi:hypothetical protein